MGNEDEIKDLVKVSKDKFLPREIPDTEERPPEFSLEEEFAKAKKNKNYKFQLVIFLFLLSVTGGTWFLTANIGQEAMESRLTFSKSEDLNLNELLSSTSDEEIRLNEAKNTLGDILQEKKMKIEGVMAKYSDQIETIRQKDLGTADQNNLINKIKVEREKEIDTIEASYTNKIAAAEDNVTQKEKAVAEKKTIIQEKATRAQDIIDNYKKLQKLKEEKLAKDITLRYNPYFQEANLQRLLSRYQRQRTPRKPLQFEYQNELIRFNTLTERQFQTLRRYTSDYQLLMQRMQRIPYRNSSERAIDTMQKTSYAVISEYERILLKTSEELVRQDRLIQSYKNAFTHLAETSPDIGVVVDARHRDNVLISLKTMARVQPGDRALVFRKSDEYIGTLIFEEGRTGLKAKIEELAPGATIHPFDKIFLQKPKPVQLPEEGETTSGKNGAEDQSTPAKGTPQENLATPEPPPEGPVPADEAQPEEQP